MISALIEPKVPSDLTWNFLSGSKETLRWAEDHDLCPINLLSPGKPPALLNENILYRKKLKTKYKKI